MSRFTHPHVMGLIGVCLDSGPAPFIVMPFMANGSLLYYLKRERKNIVLSEDDDEDTVSLLFLMCSENITYLALKCNLCLISANLELVDFRLCIHCL